jgi:hypothetical protein
MNLFQFHPTLKRANQIKKLFSFFNVALSILITQAKSLKNVKCEDKHSDVEKLTKLKTFVTDYVRIYRTVNPSKKEGVGCGSSLVAFQVDKNQRCTGQTPISLFFSLRLLLLLSEVILLDFLKITQRKS